MALSILTTDQAGVAEVSSTWQSFLQDEAIKSPISIETIEKRPPNFVATPERFFKLKFSSDANNGRFKLLKPFSVDNSEDTVLLALDQKESWSGSLKEILEAFTGEPKLPGDGVVSKILTALLNAADSQVPVKLVNPEDNPQVRNGVWLVTGQTRVTSTALVFALDLDSKEDPQTKEKISPKPAFNEMQKVLKEELDLDIGDLGPITFHMQRTSYGVAMLDKDNKLKWSVTSGWSMTLQVTISGFNFWLQQDSGETSITLTQAADDGSTVWEKLADLGSKKTVTPPTDPNSNDPPSGPDIPAAIDLLSVSLGKNLAGNFWWKIKTVFFWEPSDPENKKPPILIGLSYDSIDNSFVGELLTRKSFQYDKTLMSYRPAGDVTPGVLKGKEDKLKDEILLSDLFPEAGSLPAAIPNAISVARLSYASTKDPAQSILGLQATLVRASVRKTDVPSAELAAEPDVPCPFTWDSLAVYAQRKVSSFAFGASTSFTLNPRKEDESKYMPASLSLQVDYDDGAWRVQGRVQDLNFGVLAGFMDKDNNVGDAAIDILGKLTLTELDVLFTYSKNKQPASFLITGTITLGALELRLFYQYVGAGTEAELGKPAADSAAKRKPGDPEAIKPIKGRPQWQLRAYLGAAAGKKATLGEIIDSIAGEGEGSDVIPEFVKGIEIAPAADGAGSAVSLEVSKDKSGAAVFVLNVNVLGVKFSYMQIGNRNPPPSTGTTTPALPATGTAGALTSPQTTRILRITVDKLPLIKDIPLVGTLGQPFDKLLYLYVSGVKGLLQYELDALNENLGDDKLVYKRAIKPGVTNAVINKGHHFMIVQGGGDVVLDHVFEDETKTDKKDAKSGDNSSGNQPKDPKPLAPPSTEVTVSPVNPPSKGSLTKTLGPLTISAITLEYKSKRIYLTLDATFTLGPITLSLLGFSVGFLTAGIKLNNLSVLATEASSRISISLRGMAITFDRPPLLIAGGFEHEIMALDGGSFASAYRGGVGIGFPPYTFIGVGEYSDVTLPDGKGNYKSIFLFAKLDGPLVTLEFATISGVRLGFGFNSIVRSPKIDELTEFPFIKSSDAQGAGQNPMAILKSMTPKWVTPREGSYWLAAGMTVSSFDILAITAVAMFAFRDSGVVISIYADAVAQLPPHVPDPKGVILYVEIGMVAEMNLIDGYFRVEASLAPSSYLLVPQCHLTGGFALAYWFGNNPNAGEYVFSIGGYHRAFQPPPYYPVPARLGISFVIGDNIQMRGESYFAITPKAAMAGALIHVSLSVGPVSAYLDASFDALINFHPFHYIVEFSVSIGVECDIDILFIHIHISIHIGADLHIEGPEFGGVAHVDFWFFGFDIEFGARLGRPPPLELLEFWKTTHQPGPGSSERQDVDANPVQAELVYNDAKVISTVTEYVPNAAFKFILEDGNFPMPSSATSPLGATSANANTVPSTGAGAMWFVKGGSFRLGITTEFAISAIKIVGTTDEPKTAKNRWGGHPDGKMETEDVFSSPMHVTEKINSTLTVTITRIFGEDKPSKRIKLWREVTPNVKQVPVAMWAAYNPKLDIMALGPRARPPPTLLDGQDKATRPQTLGVSMAAPWPVISESTIPKFQASAMARMGVQNIKEVKMKSLDWYIPRIEDDQLAFKPAAERKDLEPVERWKDMSVKWTEFAANGAGWVDGFVKKKEDAKAVEQQAPDGLLSMTAAVFGWDQDANRPVGEEDTAAGERPPWLLKGAMPKKLVNGLTEFYLALPRVCV
ncbi:hypothetical protein QBC37DRAFT_288866 [Rhypophila decipiens]|uniref:DUF6603 domain-containing protein n=1 Tax=Rhypophila decipiens TaxID=261697 RepID=A0AAN6Y636_9PEZI|nr:hypothetical protein QBC37DRAFT_288866 [Rhypophila decipiens]